MLPFIKIFHSTLELLWFVGFPLLIFEFVILIAFLKCSFFVEDQLLLSAKFPIIETLVLQVFDKIFL